MTAKPGISDPAPRDLTPLPDLVQGAGLTGPARVRRPVYVDLLPPCNAGCPAGEDIQAWLAAARAGEFERARRLLTDDNPFPAICGRVCYHPYEDVCNRGDLDSAVSVHAVERFLGDWAIEHRLRFLITARSGGAAGDSEPTGGPTGKRVLIIGTGPSGLSAAYHLARRGHEVEVRDAGAEPGGMMRYGIPAYRLPREVLAAEIARIEAMGVRIVPNQYAKIFGGTVAAVDITDEKLKLAAELGADIVIDARSQDPAQVLRSRGGAEVAIGLAVDDRSFATAYSGLRRGGRLVLVALPAAGTLSVPVFDTVLNGTSVIGSIVGTRADLRTVFDLHAAGRTRVSYETRPLAEVNTAIDEVLHGKARARLVLEP